MKQKIIFALLMGSITTGIISFILISFNTGFDAHFLSRWLTSWAMSYLVVLPCIIFIGPKVQAFVNRKF